MDWYGDEYSRKRKRPGPVDMEPRGETPMPSIGYPPLLRPRLGCGHDLDDASKEAGRCTQCRHSPVVAWARFCTIALTTFLVLSALSAIFDW